MYSEKIYFGLWANDIQKYLRTGYNFRELSKVKRAILEYVSVDEDNPENIDELKLKDLLSMTGLQLDYSRTSFKSYELQDRFLSQRIGEPVNISFVL